jgi:alpha-tubulin suppressor-like RCC1 family protein
MGSHSLGIRSDFKLFAWGLNTYGQLGVDDTESRSSPTSVGTFSWTAITAGGLEGSNSSAYSAGIRAGGFLYTWGGNLDGQLGVGDRDNRSTPSQVGTSSWTAISSGYTQTIGIIAGGTRTAYYWGETTTDSRSSPVVLGIVEAGSLNPVGTSSWTAVSAGGTHTAAIRSDQMLFTWGLNSSGQLGQNDLLSRSSPTVLGANSWNLVSAGTIHTLAARSDYTLWAWGAGTNGRLGNGFTTTQSSPVQVGTSKSWVAISAGENYSLGGFK